MAIYEQKTIAEEAAKVAEAQRLEAQSDLDNHRPPCRYHRIAGR